MDLYELDIRRDALSLCREEYDYAYSIEVTSEIILDVDSNMNPIGIEFLDASKSLNVNTEVLLHPSKIFAEIINNDEGINLTMKFEFKDITRQINAPISTMLSSDDALMVSA